MVRAVKKGIFQVAADIALMAQKDPDPKLRYYAKKGISMLRSMAQNKSRQTLESDSALNPTPGAAKTCDPAGPEIELKKNLEKKVFKVFAFPEIILNKSLQLKRFFKNLDFTLNYTDPGSGQNNKYSLSDFDICE
jgi:hypothetical protein